jgi:dethiobiotin synthetase
MTFGFFITGTDTGVGKTFVAAGVLAGLRRLGVDAVPMKPVQTGCIRRAGILCAPDLEFCLAAADLVPSASERALMAPYLFQPACSPHLAAARAGVRISLPRIVRAARTLATRHACLVAEGAGGVLVPLDGRLTQLDLMRKLGLPVVLVARPGLGTINHTLLSLRALREAGLTVRGVVFNPTAPGRPGIIESDNAVTVARLGGVTVLASLPYGGGGVTARGVRTAMDRLALRLASERETAPC